MSPKKDIYILLYSGGVDSVLCLKKLVERGITPFIFHFRTTKLKKVHEKMIRKTARLLSPNSPFYVFNTKTKDYEAVSPVNDLARYSVRINRRKEFFPLEHGDYVVIGYTGWVYRYDKNMRSCRGRGRQIDLIRLSEKHSLPFIFPLAHHTRKQIDEEFGKLPQIIKENTVSSTRHYDFGGGVFV